MKLGKILKYAGYAIGGLAAIRLLYVAFSTLIASWIALIVLGIGALVHFIGVWLDK
jgi:hypothetical protein